MNHSAGGRPLGAVTRGRRVQTEYGSVGTPGGEAVRRAILLMMLLLLTPVSAMVESPYIGTAELIVTPAGDGTLVNLSEDSFEVPANATILDGWVNISTGADGDGGTGRHWIADDPAGNFSHGTLSAASLDVFETELTLGVNHTVGRLDDLETLSLRFQHYLSLIHI